VLILLKEPVDDASSAPRTAIFFVGSQASG
jgi:hypothetical protein